jgi:hypothetical protein
MASLINLDPFDRLETVDAKLTMLWQWVKTGHINLTQFKVLVRGLAVELFDETS